MYSRKSLAAACGLSVSQIGRHIKNNTYGIKLARLAKEPKVGVRFSVAKAAKFVQAMQAKHKAGEVDA